MIKEFPDLKAFADYLSVIIAKEDRFKVAFLNKVGHHVQEESKRKFGIKQEAAGPFKAWDDLAQSTQDQRVRLGYSPNDPLYRTGTLLMDSIKYKVNPIEVTVGSNEQVMVYQELGTIHIPARSVLGGAMWESKSYIIRTLKKDFENWLLNKISIT